MRRKPRAEATPRIKQRRHASPKGLFRRNIPVNHGEKALPEPEIKGRMDVKRPLWEEGV
jgi:hypothetical protein